MGSLSDTWMEETAIGRQVNWEVQRTIIVLLSLIVVFAVACVVICFSGWNWRSRNLADHNRRKFLKLVTLSISLVIKTRHLRNGCCFSFILFSVFLAAREGYVVVTQRRWHPATVTMQGSQECATSIFSLRDNQHADISHYFPYILNGTDKENFFNNEGFLRLWPFLIILMMIMFDWAVIL